jgi:SAM-dependent methyltransferase
MNRLRPGGGWRADEFCPCDDDFIAWCDASGIEEKTIFHMGCGLHHRVGRELGRPERRNRVLSITTSREELIAQADAALADAGIASRYQVLFADLYALDPALLPRFDLVTLFHLCEAPDDARPAIVLEATDLIRSFLERLNPGGRLFFYRNSTGSPQTAAALRALQAAGALVPDGAHRSLDLYQRGAESVAGGSLTHGRKGLIA